MSEIQNEKCSGKMPMKFSVSKLEAFKINSGLKNEEKHLNRLLIIWVE